MCDFSLLPLEASQQKVYLLTYLLTYLLRLCIALHITIRLKVIKAVCTIKVNLKIESGNDSENIAHVFFAVGIL